VHHLLLLALDLISMASLNIPIIGPRKIPTFPPKAKKLKALACVSFVLFSEIIALTVLLPVSLAPGSNPKIGPKVLHDSPCKDTSTASENYHL
jgi:hypothetical protein